MEALGGIFPRALPRTVVLAGGCVDIGAPIGRRRSDPKIIDGSMLLAFAHAERRRASSSAMSGPRGRDGNNFGWRREDLVLHGRWRKIHRLRAHGHPATHTADAVHCRGQTRKTWRQEYPLFDGTRARLQVAREVGPES